MLTLLLHLCSVAGSSQMDRYMWAYDLVTASHPLSSPHIPLSPSCSLPTWIQRLRCKPMRRNCQLCESTCSFERHCKRPHTLPTLTGILICISIMLYLVQSRLLDKVSAMNRSWPVFLAFLIYDWLLSFHREVRFIWNWQSRVTIPSVLYLLIRYMSIINNLLATATMHPMSDKVRNRSFYFLFKHSLFNGYIEVVGFSQITGLG